MTAQNVPVSGPPEIWVVAHTHWDREWYEPFQRFRLRLVALLDRVIDQAEADPAFRFTLDGQTAVADDYLDIRPEATERVRALVRNGQFAVGPWRILSDEFLVSGETLVQNLRQGLARAQALGGAMLIGYLPDQFGHAAQMPQLLRRAGIEQAVVWRGVSTSIHHHAFWWEAPDGSRVRAEYLHDGYDSGARLLWSTPDTGAHAEAFVERMQPWFGTAPILAMAGGDHAAPLPELVQEVAAFNASQSAARMQLGTIAQYLAARPPTEDLNLGCWQGELRAGGRANLLPGVTSTRTPLKAAMAAAEHWVGAVAEPLLALHAPVWPARALDVAWNRIVDASGHDSITGCGADDVADQVAVRLQEAREIGAGLWEQQAAPLRALLERTSALVVNPLPWARCSLVAVDLQVPPPSRADALRQAFGAPHAEGSDAVRREDWEEDLHEVLDAGGIVLAAQPDDALPAREVLREIVGSPAPRALATLDDVLGRIACTGRLVSWRIEDNGRPPKVILQVTARAANDPSCADPAGVSGARRDPCGPKGREQGDGPSDTQIDAGTDARSDGGIEELRWRLQAAAAKKPEQAWQLRIHEDRRRWWVRVPAPALGWTTVTARAVPAPRRSVTSTVSEPLALHTDAAARGSCTAVMNPQPQGKGARLGNGALTVVVEPAGTLCLSTAGAQQEAGLCGIARLVDGADAGDSYTYGKPGSHGALGRDRIVDTPHRVRVDLLAAGPLRAAVAVTRHYRWPRRLEPGDVRCEANDEVTVEMIVEVREAEPFVRLTLTFDNQSRDHRLRLHVPTAARSDRTFSEGQFAVVERVTGSLPGAAEERYGEHGLRDAPASGFVDAGGMAILLDHVRACELVEGPGGHQELALTLLRSISQISRDDNPGRAEPAGPPTPIPGAQCLGRHEVRIALYPHGDEPWHRAGVLRAMQEFGCNLLVEEGTGAARRVDPAPLRAEESAATRHHARGGGHEDAPHALPVSKDAAASLPAPLTVQGLTLEAPPWVVLHAVRRLPAPATLQAPAPSAPRAAPTDSVHGLGDAAAAVPPPAGRWLEVRVVCQGPESASVRLGPHLHAAAPASLLGQALAAPTPVHTGWLELTLKPWEIHTCLVEWDALVEREATRPEYSVEGAGDVRA